MQTTRKILTAIKLINWHFFANQTISLKNINLFSGDTGAGKSTILDAIQLILTTESRNFNRAANSESKRSIKTYVRGKTGEEGNEYLRKGAVVSYVALELYEESRDRYFVLGVKMDSPDFESDIKKKWFCEEGRLSDLSFIVDNKPAKDDQFRNNGKKIQFMYQTSQAKDRFKVRLGHLQESFFDLLPRSLAFQPMKNVKDFIYSFILPEKEINTDILRESIRSLKEMQLLVEQLKKQVEDLEKIHNKNEEILNIEKQILVNDILLKIAEAESKRSDITNKNRKIDLEKQNIMQNENARDSLNAEIGDKRERYINIQTALQTGEKAQLINQLRNEISSREKDRDISISDLNCLNAQLIKVRDTLKLLNVSRAESNYNINELENSDTELSCRNKIIVGIENAFSDAEKENSDKQVDIKTELNSLNKCIEQLAKEINALASNKITYPPNVIMLKEAVEREFSSRGLDTKVYILADLLEISDSEWQNAVEGYLNTQRFHIIVEPQYYDIASAVYDRMKSKIHTAALVNTGKLELDAVSEDNSLANVVVSENRYANAYIVFLLGRVIMCDSVSSLKKHSTAITRDCMLYKNKALRKIDPKVYRMPYIGKYALQKQLSLKKEEYDKLKKQTSELSVRISVCEKILSAIRQCNFESLKQVIDAPARLKKHENDILQLKKRLQEAMNDPTYIKLQDDADALSREIKKDSDSIDNIKSSISRSGYAIEQMSAEIVSLEKDANEIESQIKVLSDGHEDLFSEAQKKYNESKKTKNANTIFTNYRPQNQKLLNKKQNTEKELWKMQSLYKDGELGVGVDMMPEYFDEYDRLTKHDLVGYEEKLRVIRENCETEFRESFLAKMRENIENGKRLFSELNRTLKPIHYGKDSYHFKCVTNERKQRLYEMITSDFNLGGYNLFTTQFEESYRDEMDELFAKLTDSDKNGDDVVKEYTDYRSYLDYDIEIISSNGNVQYLSKIYREKSGGETQTPYYVAIAASFAQIYANRETIKVIMLDEAFDKMDDERIESMIEFFKMQGLQMILAAPISRFGVIAEQSDNIVMVYTDNDHNSTVEEYSHDEI